MSRAIRALARWCTRLTEDQARAWGERLGWWIGSAARYRRAEVAATLRRCFPEKSEADITALIGALYRHLGLLLIEACRLEALDRETVARRIACPGLKEAVDDLRRRGRGVLVLTAHLGNFEWLAALSGFIGVPLAMIAKPLHPPALNAYWNATRSRFGVRLLPYRNSYRACRDVLRRNEVLGFMLDQNMKRSGGIFVDFFGRPACTTPGLALLSAQSGAPVLPVFLIREADGRFRVEREPPIEPPAGREEDRIRAATQTYTRVIETVIRRHPEQWIWLHRRWRTQPLSVAAADTERPL